jgi:hypothetical protein
MNVTQIQNTLLCSFWTGLNGEIIYVAPEILLVQNRRQNFEILNENQFDFKNPLCPENNSFLLNRKTI